MSAEENKAIVRRYVDEVQNQGNLEILDQLLAPAVYTDYAVVGK